jgi:hypothetical protein
MTAFWFGGVLLFLAVGIILHVVAAVNRMPTDDFGALLGVAVAFDVMALGCFRRMRTFRLRTWFEYVVTPVVRMISFAVVAGFVVYGMAGRPSGSDEEVMAGFIATAAIVWIATWAVPWLWRLSVPPPLRTVPPPLPASAAAAVADVRHAALAAAATTREAVRDAVHATRGAAAATVGAVARPVIHRTPRPSRRRTGRLGRFAGALGGMLVLAGFAIAVCNTVDVVEMVAVGVPDASLRDEINRDVFGHAVPNWPDLVRNIVGLAIAVMMFAGGLGMIVGRLLGGGAAHMTRGIVGVGLLLFSLVPLDVAFSRSEPWHNLATRPEGARGGWAAVQVLVDTLRQPGMFWFLVIVVAACALFAWRPRRTDAGTAAAANGSGAFEKGV